MKDLRIYAQSWKSNGYYPVECFERINGKWYQGFCKRDEGGKLYFHFRPAYMNNNDVIFVLKYNYLVYSEKEMFDSETRMHKRDLSIDNIKNLINN